MTRGERRRRRKRKIKQRMKLISNIRHFPQNTEVNENLGEPGYFANNNETNRWGQFGRAKKTKTKHGHASYRHKGDYGKAINYCPHDLRQVEDMNEQENEVEFI